MPAFEDVWYYLWKERRLPVNVDPLTSRLKDEEERARLAKVFEQRLDHTVGFALPLQRGSAGSPSGWVSGPWFLRSEHCYLIPGDSPMGLRLPLDSLPWVSASDYPYVTPRDPFDSRPPLPPRQAFIAGSRPGVAAAGSSVTNRPADLAAAAAKSAGVSRSVANPRPRSRVRPSVLSRATVACTSSCRQRALWRITWIV